MTQALRLGIAGLGTVGVGVVKIVRRHADLLKARTGRSIEIVAVSARDPNKDRGVNLSDYARKPTRLRWRNVTISMSMSN